MLTNVRVCLRRRNHRSKGCVLKSNKRGSPVKHSNFLGHGFCEHAVPSTCKMVATGKGYTRFK